MPGTTHRLFTRIATVAATVVTAVSASVFIPAAASTARPFRASFVADEARTPDPRCGGLHILAIGSGSATRLGHNVEALFDECANFVQEPSRVHVTGTAVLTFREGEGSPPRQSDELHLQYALEGGAPDPLTGAVHVEGPYTITGGAGRFAGASGAGFMTGDTSIADTAVVITMDGSMVTHPPSNRPH